ncbi:putative polyketide synthase [Karstenula rhodostoma CBS 690.94]|uniref:Polyketide synthase n=1 Tax=Karstenula rhodostoma CBS 690.94 TaxID=1392251 RepID=A0A9P4UHF0_9PLEO|nr:putative polyketide synthase [Karstenula rhodostoma CBS 690.94]
MEFKPDHINLNGFYHPDGKRPGGMVTKGGYLLQEDPRHFDHSFFGISATEALSIDPAQRKLLEVTYEAFESAGETLESLSGSRTGVFVGNFNNEHQLMQFRDQELTLPYVVTGGGPTILSNRISHVFNLTGPSLVVDTACSASMYALHVAVLALRNGDCDAALVAGSNLILGPDNQIFVSRLGAASPTSKCHTFDIAADGYGRAEGFGAIYLKRATDAISANDPIRALVRGTSFNANGKTGGISHPSSKGQEAVIRQAYKAAGDLDPSLTGYFECHGTGTPVGDPIEVSAIGKVFASGRGDDPLLIGSIKPQLGHSEAASGMSQIMKAILAMEHNEIPATIGINCFNPAIDFAGARVKVVTETTPWPSNLLRRVSINSFGYGGANAHCIIDHPSVVLQEYQPRGFPLSRRVSPPATNGQINGNGYLNGHAPVRCNENFESPPFLTDTWQTPASLMSSGQAQARPFVLMPFSAHDDQALEANFTETAACINDYKLPDVLYSLSCRKSHLSRRGFVVGDSENIIEKMNTNSLIRGKITGSAPRRFGFIFTGQGAQWPTMGAKLIPEYSVVEKTISYLDYVLSQLFHKPSWTIMEALREESKTSRINEPSISQTVCTALQIALVNLLRQWGIEPAATVGHSSGEIAAAYAAGRLKASEAVVLAYFRGQAVATNKKKGLMLVVGMSVEQLQPYLAGYEHEVNVAAINSSKTVTLSGETEAIQALAMAFAKDHVFHRILETGYNAYHSHHMLALGEDYETCAVAGLEEVAPKTLDERMSTSTPWISSVTPNKQVHSVSPRYWRRNLESPVRFSQAIEKLAEEDLVDLCIEIGPHSALTSLFKQIRTDLESKGQPLPQCLPSLKRGENDVVSMLNLAGNLFLKGAPINLVAVNASENVQHGKLVLEHGSACIDLPTYNFTYGDRPLYFENRFNREFRTRRHPRHDLLGARQPGLAHTHPSWRNVLRMKDARWLDDHKLLPYAVLPAAAYIAMAIEAVSQLHLEDNVLPIKSFRLRNVAINSTLRVPDDEFGIETMLNLTRVSMGTTREKSAWFKFSIASAEPESDTWTEHCTGSISVQSLSTKIDWTQRLRMDPRSRSLDITRWYEKFSETGLGYGPAFQGLSQLQAYHGSNTVGASVTLAPAGPGINADQSSYTIHPATLDTCIQLGLIACHAGQVENVKKSFIPVVGGDITIWVQPDSGSMAQAIAQGNISGIRSAAARIQLHTPSGQPLLDLNELRLVTFEENASDTAGSLHMARDPYWRSVERVDIDSLTTESAVTLFPSPRLTQEKQVKFDKFGALVISDIYMSLEDGPLKRHAGTHQPFADWALSWKHAVGDDPSHPEQKASLLQELQVQLADLPEVECLSRLHQNLDRILSTETSTMELLLQDGLLDRLYTSGVTFQTSRSQLRNVLDLQAHKLPRMRILQLGGELGYLTTDVLETLAANTSFKRFENLTITNATAWARAREYTVDFDNDSISYKPLDTAQDPTAQGFEAHSFDLVLALGSLSLVPDTATALHNIHTLLKPGGKLISLETMHSRPGLDILFRSLQGNWNLGSPASHEAGWSRVLEHSGFSGIDLALEDGRNDDAFSRILLTTSRAASRSNAATTEPPVIWLLYRDYPPPLASLLSRLLRDKGYKTSLKSFLSSEQVSENAIIISFVDIESSTLLHRDATHFQMIQAVIRKASYIMWLAAGTGPESAVMKGLLRSISTENPLLKTAFIDIDSSYYSNFAATANVILDKILSQVEVEQDVGTFDDTEWKLKDGVAYIERLLPDEELNRQFRLRHGYESNIEERPMDGQGFLRVNYRQPGVLSSLYFSSDPTFDEPLQDDWVEIENKGIGLNVKDLAVATGRFDLNYLSTEAAGVVSRVGSAVNTLNVGDRVFGLVPGNMGNYTRSEASLVQTIPHDASTIDAATMPVVYLTAIYALRHLARLEAGESILIQSATGGLGLAALRLAQRMGATVYATVGNDEKRKLLQDEFGIPGSRIFNSRDAAGIEALLQATGYNGLDVILSSARGDAMHDAWRCIAPAGRFIEVGRTDVLASGSLPLDVFKRNATFASFDLGLLYRQKPELVGRLTAELRQLWVDGVIGPIHPHTTYDLSRLEEAMAFFSKGVHLGKVVVTFDNPQAPLKIMQVPKRASFDPEATYLLVGCLGGLGRSLAVWMVERGARCLMFLSRSGATSPEASSIIGELQSMGAAPEVVQCSVTDLGSLSVAISQIPRTRPLKGIVHAAMVEGDSFFDNSSFSQVHDVLAPKVTGTINLHNATKHLPLDFFVMTSSIVGLVGTASQGAYVAANAFQDAFARHRQSSGHAAISLALGLINEIGSVKEAQSFQQMLLRTTTYGISESEFLQHLEAAFAPSAHPSTTLDPLSPSQVVLGLEPANFIPHFEDGRMREITWTTSARFQAVVQAISDRAKSRNSSPSKDFQRQSDVVAQMTLAASPAEKKTIAAEAVIARIGQLLSVQVDDIDASRPMAQYGLDSLVAAELRSWLATTFRIQIPLMHMLSQTTKIQDLVDILVEQVGS